MINVHVAVDEKKSCAMLRIYIDRAKGILLLLSLFVCASVVSYVAVVLLSFVPLFSLFWAALRDRGIFWVSSLTFKPYTIVANIMRPRLTSAGLSVQPSVFSFSRR